MNEQLINGIYNNCKDLILQGVDPSLTETILFYYEKYLNENYADTLDPGDDINQAVEIYTKMEKKRWEGKNIDAKLKAFIRDEKLQKLTQISNIGYKHAQRKLGHIISEQEYTPELTEEQVNEYITEMERLITQVQPYNQSQAKMALSEGIMDFEYASNKTNNTSLRIGRMR